MKKFSKKYVEASKKIEKNKEYSLEEAIKLVKETAVTKFDSSVELALRLNLDPKKADQQLRGATVLPNGTGKTSIYKNIKSRLPNYSFIDYNEVEQSVIS